MISEKAAKTQQAAAIPVFRPDITEEEIAAVAETLRSQWIGNGPRTAEFERQFAEFIGARFAVSTGTGTAALQAAMAGLGLAAGDEIILPAFTWVSAFQVIRELGGTPVFADIEPNYLTIDPEDIARLITPRTRGIVAVHHGGQLADLNTLRELASAHGLWLLEDAAHACGAFYFGRRAGSGGTIACFSFNAMKNLTTGDGGMVTTDDADLAERVRVYRSLGIDRDTYTRYRKDHPGAAWVYDVVSEGQRVHMNDIAAAIGLVQLKRLDQMNGKRGCLVERYLEGFSDLPGLHPVLQRPGTHPSHHMFTVRVPNRDRFIDAMREREISIGVHYIPIHEFSVAQPYRRTLPVTEKIWKAVATLPLYAAMTISEQDRVIGAVREIVPTL
jgi:perosamine synthetase